MIPSSPNTSQQQQQQQQQEKIQEKEIMMMMHTSPSSSNPAASIMDKVGLLNINQSIDTDDENTDDENDSTNDLMPSRSVPSSPMISSSDYCFSRGGATVPSSTTATNTTVIGTLTKQVEGEDNILMETDDIDSSSSTTSSCSSLPITGLESPPLRSSSSSASTTTSLRQSSSPISIFPPNSLYQVCNTKRNLISTSPILISMFEQPNINNNNYNNNTTNINNNNNNKTVENKQGNECCSNHSTPQTPIFLSPPSTLPITTATNTITQLTNTTTTTKSIHFNSDDESHQLDSSFTDEDDLLDSSSSEEDEDNSKNTNSNSNKENTQSNLSLSSSEIRKRSISITFPDLTLLSHQVAGQCPLLKLPDGKVLKPLVPTEYQFYRSLEFHPEFIDFTPKFYGIDHFGLDHEYLEQSCNKQSTIFNYTHWKNKIIKLPKENQNMYIKIEDLTFSCKYPCILDLKMGVRQHGNDAPTEKVNKMVEKCKLTTSSSLGFRVCGLKVYNLPTGEYITYDKYYGRSLKDQDIPLVLCKYLDNGLRNRIELLPLIAKRLGQIISLFEQQQCYKFYGGSLLFIYDGQSTNSADSKLTIKMVDFAHAHPTTTTTTNIDTTNNNNQQLTNNNSNNKSPKIDDQNSLLDEGYLFGLRNLLKLINTLIQVSNNSNNLNTI